MAGSVCSFSWPS